MGGVNQVYCRSEHNWLEFLWDWLHWSNVVCLRDWSGCNQAGLVKFCAGKEGLIGVSWEQTVGLVYLLPERADQVELF